MRISPVIFVPDLCNAYVLDMTEHAQLDETMEGLCDFGTPVVASNSTLLGATAIVAGQRITLVTGVVITEPFGRTLNITSTAAGTLTIIGRDYLNQPMIETVTCIVGTVATLKAFKRVDALLSGTVAGNVSIGPGTGLGFPFVVSNLPTQYNDGLAVAAPTVTAAVIAVQTATTGDPRGTFVPTGTLNGVLRVEATVRFNQNAIGGLYGRRHFAG